MVLEPWLGGMLRAHAEAREQFDQDAGDRTGAWPAQHGVGQLDQADYGNTRAWVADHHSGACVEHEAQRVGLGDAGEYLLVHAICR